MKGPTSSYENYDKCISLSTNDMTTSKSKNIDFKYYYIREVVK